MARMNVIVVPPKKDLDPKDIAVILSNLDKKVGHGEKITFSPSGLVLSKEDWDFYVKKYSDLLKPKPKITPIPEPKTYEQRYWEFVNFSGTGNPVSDYYESQKMLEDMCSVVTIDTEHVVDKPTKSTFLEDHPSVPRNVLWAFCIIWLVIHLFF